MHNLILCGFMGSGKTVVARALAQALHMEYVDLDEQLEREHGRSISDWFATLGEADFREAEHEAVAELSQRIRCVVATGGGALTFPRNVAAISREDTVIFLNPSFEVCYQRCVESGHRPIFKQKTEQELLALYEMRQSAYLAAAKLVFDSDCLVSELVKKIIAALPK